MNRELILKILKEVKLQENIVNHVIATEKLALKTSELIKLNNPSIEINTDLISSGALLHDIGRSVTHSIKHAIEGVKIARKYNMPKEILPIIERHIGAGISKKRAVQLGLPPKDYIPVSLEEKIVSNSDNLLYGDKRRKLQSLYLKLISLKDEEAAKRVLKLNEELSKLAHFNLDELEL